MPMIEKELLERDAGRNIGKELLKSVREMKANKRGREHGRGGFETRPYSKAPGKK